MPKSSGHFRFRRGDSLGAADAENDSQFLKDCFVDTGDRELLLDCSNVECIVVGRTGSGKSALLLEVETCAAANCIRISPADLSMNYIANSDAVRILTDEGVNLDPFFKLLWRHVIALTIFQYVRPVSDEERNEGLRRWIGWLVRDDKTTEAKRARHQHVIAFLERYGGKGFFGDVSSRVKEIVRKFETEVSRRSDSSAGMKAGVSNGVADIGARIEANRGTNETSTIVEELRLENRARFQQVVNEIQVQELQGILDLIAEVLEDGGRDIYVLIDGLDTDWADESIRFNLIRALIETAIDFRRVPRAKVILAMRIDLIERVYRDARHEPGSQAEKVRDYCLTLNWDRPTLTRLLDRRVERLVRDRYAPAYAPTHKDVLSMNIRKGRGKGADALEYILERTWYRPRDVLVFFNACIDRAAGTAKISNDALREAEGDYSRGRLLSLAEEWQLEYVGLDETIRMLLRGRERRLHVSDIDDDVLMNWTVSVLERPPRSGDRLSALALRLDADRASMDDIRLELAAILYKVGAVGVQIDEEERALWATNYSYSLSATEIRPDSFLYVHPGLWKVLGIRSSHKRRRIRSRNDQV